MDSRLVVLNAMDARTKGAEIRTRCPLRTAVRSGDTWQLSLFDELAKKEFQIEAKVLINASGPWLDELLNHISHSATREHIRMVQGSHIIVRQLFDHGRAYIFQNADGRIIFAIPYENEFTLIGTTDRDFHGNPDTVHISPEETDYLCKAASEYFLQKIVKEDVVSSFSGIRPLFDDGKSEAKAATRDYVLKLDTGKNEAPLLSIYGGKITTYRKLAESVLDRLAQFLPTMGGEWTEPCHLPGGDFRPEDFDLEVKKLMSRCPALHRQLATRLFRSYGTRAYAMADKIKAATDLGPHFGHDLYGFEVDYLLAEEWAGCAEDILWRRGKLGLFLSAKETEALDGYIKKKVSGKTHSLPTMNGI
jgi:glycerol-3-phosphate dehydrogenase